MRVDGPPSCKWCSRQPLLLHLHLHHHLLLDWIKTASSSVFFVSGRAAGCARSRFLCRNARSQLTTTRQSYYRVDICSVTLKCISFYWYKCVSLHHISRVCVPSFTVANLRFMGITICWETLFTDTTRQTSTFSTAGWSVYRITGASRCTRTHTKRIPDAAVWLLQRTIDGTAGWMHTQRWRCQMHHNSLIYFIYSFIWTFYIDKTNVKILVIHLNVLRWSMYYRESFIFYILHCFHTAWMLLFSVETTEPAD